MLRMVAMGREGCRGFLGSCGMNPVASMWYKGVPGRRRNQAQVS